MAELDLYANQYDDASDPLQVGTDLRLLDLPCTLVQRAADDSSRQAKSSCRGLE